MGLYVNPVDGDKLGWLERNGVELPYAPGSFATAGTARHPLSLAVCLVDNGAFYAAGVAFSQAELEAFNRTSDDRAKRWFSVTIEDLDAVTGGLTTAYLASA